MNQFVPGLDAVHEGERAGLDAGARQGLPRLPDPGSPGRRGRAASTFASKSSASARRCASSVAGVAGIGDDHEALVAEPRDDQVVDDAGLLVEEEGVFRLARSQARRHRSGQARFEQCRGSRDRDLEQLHVRDVEQAGMLAGMEMLLHHAGRIGERHRPAGKRAEARAGGLCRSSRGRCLGVFARHDFSRDARNRPLMAASPCPSV